jgi:hypothetical protein
MTQPNSTPPTIIRLVMRVTQQEEDHPLLGRINSIKQWLVDAQTRLAPSDDQVHAHFRNLTATGIMVKRRLDPDTHAPTQPANMSTLPPDNLPHYGVIDGITPTHVLLIPPRATIRVEGYPPTMTNEQVARIPRGAFHTLYEID